VRAVGLGRPFLYSLVYGEEGAAHLVDSTRPSRSFTSIELTREAVLKDELEMSMKSLGLTDVAAAAPRFVNTLGVDAFVPGEKGHPYVAWEPKPRL
jgi:L-lactate dehydrogenase (cytochrome)